MDYSKDKMMKEEAELIEEFENVFLVSTQKVEVSKILSAWNKLMDFMNITNRMSNMPDKNSLLWQYIGNWAVSIVDTLNEMNQYQEVISVNEDILKMDWRNPNGSEDSTFYENAKRNIADAYAAMGNVDKACQLYREYLKQDELWGFGWLGYCWILEEYDKEKYIDVLNEIYAKVIIGIPFRDKANLVLFLCDRFLAFGEHRKVAALCQKYHKKDIRF